MNIIRISIEINTLHQIKAHLIKAIILKRTVFAKKTGFSSLFLALPNYSPCTILMDLMLITIKGALS